MALAQNVVAALKTIKMRSRDNPYFFSNLFARQDNWEYIVNWFNTVKWVSISSNSAEKPVENRCFK